MGWVLTASGSLAGPLGSLDRAPSGMPQTEPRRLERAEDRGSRERGLSQLTARPGGALQASLTWTDLDVTKTVQRNGDFHARLAGRQDVLVLIRTGNRLRVTRDGQTAVLLLDRADEEGLDAAQMVLAGSHAARAFRGLHRGLSEECRESAPGVALDNLDVLLAILQGEGGAASHRAPPRRDAGGRVCRAAYGACSDLLLRVRGRSDLRVGRLLAMRGRREVVSRPPGSVRVHLAPESGIRLVPLHRLLVDSLEGDLGCERHVWEVIITAAVALCLAGPLAAIVLPLAPEAWRRPPLVWGTLLATVVLVAGLRRLGRRRR